MEKFTLATLQRVLLEKELPDAMLELVEHLEGYRAETVLITNILIDKCQ